ncbi:ribulose-5-phosphate 4-epimerase/fuculose-1-phosphate aldolase [Labrys monachus]|uniref:Ribulose-5-phosphate 4-epimerase/fuculose-1-phosphate aldolase n=2 Tax=Labrys monachus TaxID=217067 RepID=A0ABU0FE67_9HYPH|nr:ribulose-5-phosphate 4-epimerase/fuculose-1-phosphate aldolase [Labrys monachus]
MSNLTTYRRELAAALRLAAKLDYNEGICNHFSVQVPGPEELYLFNPYGVHWLEMRPSDLLLVDGEGTLLEGEGELEATARNIHIAGHRANPRHLCLLHTHMPWATSLTMVEGGRLEMAHQTAARFHGRIAYNDEFGGFASGKDEGERIASTARSDQRADVVFLAQHGVIVGGPSVAIAFDDLYFLERACRQQVLAMSTGRPLKIIPQQMVESTAREWMNVLDHQATLHFQALMRVNGL